jgi:DNA-binding HxlR family transcriptional regulator
MALGVDYAQQDCSIARALEIVGERWTLLIVRDSFFGVRRFGDFQAHLDISKAVLTERLTSLTRAGLLIKVPRGGRDDYVLTERGMTLWPTLFALSQWGEQQAPADGPRRIFSHVACGTDLRAGGWCSTCTGQPGPTELVMRPGPGARQERRDEISLALQTPRRVLEPIRPT